MEQFLATAAGGHEDAIARQKLIVGGSVANLDNIAIANGYDDAARLGTGRPAQDDLRCEARSVNPPAARMPSSTVSRPLSVNDPGALTSPRT